MEKGWAWEIAVAFVGGEGCGRPTRGAHTLGDWPVVPTGEGEGTPRGAGPLPFRGWIHALAHLRPASAGMTEKTGGGGDGRSRTLAQEDGDACTDG